MIVATRLKIRIPLQCSLVFRSCSPVENLTAWTKLKERKDNGDSIKIDKIYSYIVQKDDKIQIQRHIIRNKYYTILEL